LEHSLCEVHEFTEWNQRSSAAYGRAVNTTADDTQPTQGGLGNGVAARRQTRWRVLAVILLVAAALGVALWPPMTQARRNAQHLKTGTRMRSLAQALLNYANDNRMKFPPHGADVIAVLNARNLISDDLLASFQSDDPASPPRVLYCPPVSFAGSAQAVLLLENPLTQTEGINVVYGDGHVEFIPAAGVSRALIGVKQSQALDGTPFVLPTP
jgi:prepilin-type processing-associated H-X9-DG protein